MGIQVYVMGSRVLYVANMWVLACVCARPAFNSHISFSRTLCISYMNLGVYVCVWCAEMMFMQMCALRCERDSASMRSRVRLYIIVHISLGLLSRLGHVNDLSLALDATGDLIYSRTIAR